MTTIPIDGIIGWDVSVAEIRQQLSSANGPVNLAIHSPGGSVYDGIAIFNAIRDHRRAGHPVTATVSGIAASMATYIAMAAETVTVEDNAVWMIHNPYVMALGDHREMQKTANILSSLSSILGRAYAAKTGDTLDTIAANMDSEQWLFGSEIVAAGYADVLVPAGDGAEARLDALALAQHAFSAMQAKLREADSAQIHQIAAMLPHAKQEAVVATETKTAETVIEEEAEQVEQAETAAPNVEEAIQAALASERQRVSTITARCAQVGMSDLAAALIASGASLAQANAAIVDSWVAKGGAEIRQSPSSEKPPIDIAAAQQKLFAQVAGK